MKNKPLEIDMAASSELKDSQGETLNLEGADISELTTRGRLNDNHGQGFYNSLGRVTYAKKIFKREDCESEREKYYWEKVKAPYLYVKGLLYDNEEHPNAKAAAAILRHVHKADTALKVKASVEGGVLQRNLKDPTRLERTKIHSVALTFTPANSATLVEPINVNKSTYNEEIDMALIKSVIHLAKDDKDIPSFRHIERHAQADKILENLNKMKDLAGSMGIDISFDGLDAEKLANEALKNKIRDNVIKINDLTKAIKSKLAPVIPQAGAKYNAARTNITGAIKPSPARDYPGLKVDAGKKRHAPSGTLTTPESQLKPSSAIKIVSPQQHQINIKTKSVALKLRQDPTKWKMVKQSIAESKLAPEKKQQLIASIFKEMQEPDLNKSLLPKSFLRGVRSVVAAGGLIYGAHQMSPYDSTEQQVTQEVKPKTTAERMNDIKSTIDNKANVKEVPKPKTLKERVDEIKDKQIKGLIEYYQHHPEDPAAVHFVDWAAEHYGLNKALTAGYGGAGTPTSLTGGGVLQRQSLEDDKTRYIICDSCGAEQIHHTNQVKCRKCNKNFSLEKLYRTIKNIK